MVGVGRPDSLLVLEFPHHPEIMLATLGDAVVELPDPASGALPGHPHAADLVFGYGRNVEFKA